MTANDRGYAAMVTDAFERGQTALEAGEKTLALRWLERAHRLAPDDGTIALSLASALIGADNARSATLFARVLAVHDVRDAWAGLTMARFLARDLAGAREALEELLTRHTPHPGLAPLAYQIADATSFPGWCGLTAAGALAVHPAGSDPVEIWVDRKRLDTATLPPAWPRARRIQVIARGHPLLGSPIVPGAIATLDAYAEASEDGVSGWAWHPADPDTDPVLSIHRGGHRRTLVATAPADGIGGLPPLAKPRRFLIPWTALPAGDEPVHVRGPDGRDLTGSPVFQAPAQPPRARRPAGDRTPRDIRVVVLASNDPAAAHDCLNGVLDRLPSEVPVWLHGAAPPPRHRGRVTRCDGDIVPAEPCQDLVMVDGIAPPPADWLDRLRSAAGAAADIGSVTPFSNRGQAAYPGPAGVSMAWFGDGAADQTCQALPGGDAVRIPFGGGPCWFVRGDCLAATGPVRLALFGARDAAQRDFSARASAAGWRHAALPGLFVAQRAEPASGAAAMRLRTRNTAWLKRMYQVRPPRTDPLRQARRALDIVRWQGGPPRPSVILVTHDDGGGVERRIESAVRRHEALGRRAIVLRPAPADDGQAVMVQDGLARHYPNLRFAMPREKAALARLLRDTGPVEAEIHHFLNHHPAVFDIVRAMKVAYDVHVHDYIWFCIRVALVNERNRYCGEPDTAGCEVCAAAGGDTIAEPIAVPALLNRSRAILSAARTVTAPSQDAAARMMAHFPGIAVTVVPHEDDLSVPEPPPIQPVLGRVRVCVAGAVGLHKGFQVLLACARDARRRDLDLEFVVVGTTIDDQRLMDTGRAFVTGRYESSEAVALIAAQGATLALLPSICPETWCFGLTEIWRAGLRAVAFDMGAPAERIRRTGRGLLIPAGMSPRAINDILLNAGKGRSALPVRRSSD